jgi:hypothetical protein
MKPKYPWKARLIVALIMLILAFIGMVITDVRTTGGWDYWKKIVLAYAVLALWLSWYVKRQTQVIAPVNLWHELLHWVGLIAAVYLVSYYVHLGIMSRFIAGLFQLTLLSLGIFIAGIYIEATFLFIGIMLGLFALLAAAVVEYLYAFIIPLLILSAGLIVLIVLIARKKSKKSSSN